MFILNSKLSLEMHMLSNNDSLKKSSDFFTIGGSCTRTPPRERCVWNQTEFLLWIFVIFDWSLLIFIAVQTGTHAKNLHNLIQSHSVCCGLQGCEIGSFTSNMSIFRAGLGVSTCASWCLKYARFPVLSKLCFSSCRSEDLPNQLPRLRVAIFNAFPSRVLPHPGARCYLEWSSWSSVFGRIVMIEGCFCFTAVDWSRI